LKVPPVILIDYYNDLKNATGMWDTSTTNNLHFNTEEKLLRHLKKLFNNADRGDKITQRLTLKWKWKKVFNSVAEPQNFDAAAYRVTVLMRIRLRWLRRLPFYMPNQLFKNKQMLTNGLGQCFRLICSDLNKCYKNEWGK
jgi:hypothetical protein